MEGSGRIDCRMESADITKVRVYLKVLGGMGGWGKKKKKKKTRLKNL